MVSINHLLLLRIPSQCLFLHGPFIQVATTLFSLRVLIIVGILVLVENGVVVNDGVIVVYHRVVYCVSCLHLALQAAADYQKDG